MMCITAVITAQYALIHVNYYLEFKACFVQKKKCKLVKSKKGKKNETKDLLEKRNHDCNKWSGFSFHFTN